MLCAAYGRKRGICGYLGIIRSVFLLSDMQSITVLLQYFLQTRRSLTDIIKLTDMDAGMNKFGSKLPNSLLVAVPQARLAVCGGIKMTLTVC